MPLKPIQSGNKVWCLNLQGGYLYNFEIYQSKGSKNEFSDNFGLGLSVVLGLLKPLTPGQFCAVLPNSGKRWWEGCKSGGGGIRNIAGGNFFAGWWEPGEEWFWRFEPFSKLKTVFCKYWTSIKIKISMTCVSKKYEIKTTMVQEQ